MEKEYHLKTGRLGFSTWKTADLDIATLLWGNPAVTKLISSSGMTDEMVQKRLDFELSHYASFGVQYFPLFLLDTREFIGCCGLRVYDSEPGDLGEGVYELGCHLLPEFWGKEHAREASEAMINYGFNVLNLKAIFAGHHPENVASANLLKKLGFEFSHYHYFPPTGLEHPCYLLYNSPTG